MKKLSGKIELLSKEELKKLIGGFGGSGSGGLRCPTYGCGAGGNGTCESKVVEDRIQCVCTDEGGGICV